MTTAAAPTLVALDGLQLADALRAGIYRLFEKTDHINKINVFPVPDGDTGTNMSMTLSAVLAALDREPVAHAGKLLLRAADAALDGARGNSGAILAQFLLGLGDSAGHLAKIDVRSFVTSIATGAAYARDALSQPREGTLLTVLREFAQSGAELGDGVGDFARLFRDSLVGVRAALDRTRTQLEELRAANVVDAGALGFVEVLEGMSRFLETGEMSRVSAPVHVGEEVMVQSTVGAAQDFRFCTECLVTAFEGADIDLRHLRERLGPVGASLVVSGSKRKAKVHVHVDDPEHIFRLAGEFGVVGAQKADDMRLQQRSSHHATRQRVAVATDSGADIPDEFIERYGIHMVPARIHFGAHSHLDKVSLTPAEFYRELARNPEHPKTSQPPPGDFRRTFEFLASHYEAVVSVNLTSRHSGTCNAARSAAQRVSAEGRPVRVIDSLNASTGEGLVAIAAAEAAAAGGDLEAVEAAAREAVLHTRTFALLNTVDFAVRGGRVPAIVGKIAKLLRLNVILCTDPGGRVAAGGGLIGRHSLRERFVRFVVRRVPFDRRTERLRIFVGHGDLPAAGAALLEDLRRRLGDEVIEFAALTDMGPAVGVHGGPGTLIVAVHRVRKIQPKAATTSGGA